MEKKLLDQLLKTFEGIEITEEELNSLKWLSGWEPQTIDNICKLVEKIKVIK
jgi:hypothetical protein